MFQFPSFASLNGITGLQPAGLPHSEICGSIRICRSPQLIAAYYVLLRLKEPRHPPYALNHFLLLSQSQVIKFYISNLPFPNVLFSFLFAYHHVNELLLPQ